MITALSVGSNKSPCGQLIDVSFGLVHVYLHRSIDRQKPLQH